MIRGLKEELGEKHAPFEALLLKYVVLKNNLYIRNTYTDAIISFLDTLRKEIQTEFVNITVAKNANVDVATEKWHRLVHITNPKHSGKFP